jgi:hypothetical protein
MGCAAASTVQYPGLPSNPLLPRSDLFAIETTRRMLSADAMFLKN